MPTALMPEGRQRYYNNDGTPCSGGQLWTYAAGTTAPKTTWADEAGATPNPNPVPLDAHGEAVIYWNGAYKVNLLQADGQQVTGYPVDNLKTDPAGLWGIFTTLAASAGAGLLGFVASSGAAIKRTVLSKLLERPSLLDFMTDAQRADVLSNAGTIDVSAAVQAAIDAYVDPEAPAGTYLINTPLLVTSDLHLKGKKRKTVFRKTSTATNVVTRTYTDSTGAQKTLTWDQPVVFNLVCPNNSYLVDVNLDGFSFDLPADGSVGALHAQRVAYSSFRNLFCNNSKFFAKGYDMFEILWENIRSRFSITHFTLDTGTSHTFRNVAADLKNPTSGIGFSISNLFYSEMSGCAADSLDTCYDFVASQIAMNGCGAESFSRIIRARQGSQIAIHGGALKIFKNAGLTGTYTPYEFDDAGTVVTMNNTWLGVANPADPGGTYAVMAVTAGAKVTMNSIRNPVELNGGVGNWWYVTGAGSLLTLLDPSGVRYITANGLSRLDGVSDYRSFMYTKTAVPAGSAQSIFRINNASYGSNCFGRVRVLFTNAYGSDLGFVGEQEYKFACFKETTASQVLTKVAEAFALSNTGTAGFGGVTASLVRNADNTVDFQITVANAPQVVGNSNITVIAEYMNGVNTNVAADVITGV